MVNDSLDLGGDPLLRASAMDDWCRLTCVLSNGEKVVLGHDTCARLAHGFEELGKKVIEWDRPIKEGEWIFALGLSDPLRGLGWRPKLRGQSLLLNWGLPYGGGVEITQTVLVEDLQSWSRKIRSLS